MDRGLFKFILRHGARQQLVIVALTVLSLPFYYAALDFPRQIINKGLGVEVERFPASLKVWGIELIHLEQFPLLAALCFALLTAVTVNGALKYVANLKRARLGELLLRRLRLNLCSQALRFPSSHFRNVSPAELVSMITSEVESLGGFIGDAISVPVLQLGLLLTAFLFIFAQDVVLGLASVALLPVQIVVVPRIQRQVNRLSRKRVREMRRLSRRFSESVSLASHLQTNAMVAHELEVLDHRLGRILEIRYQIFRKKFFVKFFNNFLAQLAPFLLFLIGGYFVIRDELTVGALVAVVVAYKDVPPPWKELLDYYQDQQDARVRYEQVTSRFRPAGIVPIQSFEGDGAAIEAGGRVEAIGLGALENDDPVLSNLSFTLDENEHVIAVGADYREGQTLARLLIGLQRPHEGSVLLDGVSSTEVSKSKIAHMFTYVDGDPRFFTGTIMQNLAYGLPGASQSGWREEALEALRIGGLGEFLVDFGLEARVDLRHNPELEREILRVRGELRQRLADLEGGRVFRPFQVDKYHDPGTVLENLIFGSLDKETVDIDQLLSARWFRATLRNNDLEGALEQLVLLASSNTELGRRRMPLDTIELLSDRASELQSIVSTVGNGGTDPLLKSQRRLLLSLALAIVIDRIDFDFSTAALKAAITASRAAMREAMPSAIRRAVIFFDAQAYNPGMTLRDNLLFGRPDMEYQRAAQRVAAVLEEAIESTGLHDHVVAAALDFHIGVAGSKLSREYSQKLGLARAVLTPAKTLIACHAVSAMSMEKERTVVKALTAAARGRGLLWITERAELAQYFDRVLVFAGGNLKEQGGADELSRAGTYFSRLITDG